MSIYKIKQQFYRKMTEIKFIDQEYSWRTLTLYDFLITEQNIPETWEEFFLDENKFNLRLLSKQLYPQFKSEPVRVPEINLVFNAFYKTRLPDIKVVILGQDPYYNGSAMGLCFSVLKSNKVNPSVQNIYKELINEGFTPKTRNGDLTHWAKQGVLMLNTALTTEFGKAEKDINFWYWRTQNLLEYIDSIHKDKIDWILLGTKAINAAKVVKSGNKLMSTHPSPLSATRKTKTLDAFIGSGIFRKVRYDIEW
jgi:uracil-DNA glycosylase